MTVNPYAATAVHAPVVSAPMSEPTAVSATTKRKTNWWTMTGALIGLAVGFLTAEYPTTAEVLPAFDHGKAWGHVVGHAIGIMLLGAFFGWLVGLVVARPIRGLIILGVVGGLGALVMATVAARVSLDRQQIDPTRHREPGRVQAGNDSFSLVLPGTWKRVPNADPSPECIFQYAGPIQRGIAATIVLAGKNMNGRITPKFVEEQAHRALPKNATLQAVRNMTIDGKPAYCIEGYMHTSGRKIWVMVNLFKSREKFYQLMAFGCEPKSNDMSCTLRELVNSVRVD